MQKLSGWIAAIGTAIKGLKGSLRRSVSSESHAGRIATTDGRVSIDPTATGGDAEFDHVNATSIVPDSVPDDQEIQRRRDLVRQFFNDFWNGREDKPAKFVDRLNRAQKYINERLAQTGEGWQFDAGNRRLLGLPPPS